MATAGGMGPGTIEALGQLLDALGGEPAAMLVAATDADRAGDRYAETFARIAGTKRITAHWLRPPRQGDDWNDVLRRGRWASFINNAGVRVLFNLDDYDSAHYWSQFIGGQLVGTMSQAQDVFGITEKQTVSEALRPLLSPDQIMLTFAADKMLVLHQGSRPISAERVPYFEDEALKGLWDDPRGPTVVQGPWSRTTRPA